MYARNRKTGAKIVGAVDQVLGTYGIIQDSFRRNAAGEIEHTDDGSGTQINWDTTEHYMFQDENWDHVKDADIELIEDPAAAVPHEDPAKVTSEPDVTIVLRGGLVTDVKFPDGSTRQITVRVEDEEVEGLDKNGIERDPDGREYQVSTWP